MKPTERFTQTVTDYIKYRPSYPHEVIQVLIDECELTPDQIIADVGSGTGLLAKLFLEYGNTVYGVEPNAEMRNAAEILLHHYPRFHSIDGSAEHSTLENQSVGMVTAGTAFHWFDASKSLAEFKRILKPPGWVMLVWNVRAIEKSDLVRDYEQLIMQYCKEYRESRAQQFDKTLLADFFAPYEMKMKSFRNSQSLDWEGLQGRLLSSSFSLRPHDPDYQAMLAALKKIFDQYQQAGTIEFLYDTKMYYSHLYPLQRK